MGPLFSAWKSGGENETDQHDRRLQWGHVFSDVEIRFSARILSRFLMLQWGHVFSDVEIENMKSNRTGEPVLQWGHVFSDVEILHGVRRTGHRFAASMGPRLFRRGNSRGVTVAAIIFALQWGHVFSDVEMVRLPAGGPPGRSRFNGATSFQTWKYRR